MPRAKRAPIDYTPQFGGGIFRPKDAVEEELAEIEQADGADGAEPASVGDQPAAPLDGPRPPTAMRPPESVRLNGRTVERSNDRTDERSNGVAERPRVRHSFDVYSDQLLALGEIQIQLHRRTGRKPKLGDLVQEAPAAYIAPHNRTDARTNARTNVRSR